MRKRLTQILRGRLAVLAILLLFSGYCRGQDERPLVLVSFIIPDSLFPDIEQERRADLKKNVKGILVDYCREYYRFLRWAPLSDSAAMSPEVTALILKMVQRQSSEFTWIDLEFIGRIQSSEVAMQNNLENKELYGKWADRPSHDPVRLQTNIVEWIGRQFDLDDFRSRLLNGFLYSIPIAREVFSIREFKIIIVPIRFDSLQAGSDSKFRVDFICDNLCGNMELGLKAGYTGYMRPEYEGMTQCQMLTFYKPPIEEEEWTDSVATTLEHVYSWRVYMKQYVWEPFPNTLGATATEP